MNFRHVNIATRLALGFGFCVVSAALLLAFAMVDQERNRARQAEGSDRQALLLKGTSELRTALLEQAVAVRNMGLEQDVPSTARHRAEAQAQRKRFLARIDELERSVGAGPEMDILTALEKLDREMGKSIDEAAGLLSIFVADQAILVIRNDVGPLLAKSKAQLDRLDQAALIRATAASEEVRRLSEHARWLVCAASAAVLACICAIAWRVTRSVVGPLKQALHAAEEVARGNLDFVIPVGGRDEAARLMGGLDKMRLSLAAMVGKVRGSADMVALASREIAQGNQDLSTRTESQTGVLQEVASTMGELEATVRKTADHALQASQRARQASGVAVRGGEVVAQVVATMREINTSSSQIAEIIGVIDGIAFQTNILALNAAVEAARAGEQGRGFAVVASEVRTLAQRSADAARRIKALIATSVERAGRGGELVQRAGESMNEIVDAIRGVSTISGEISAATREQSAGVGDVVRSVTSMDQTTQQNAALVEQGAFAAESLRSQAERLVATMAVFRLGETPGTVAGG